MRRTPIVQKRSSRSLDQRVALRRFKAEVFQVLAHPTRIHIAECLRTGRRPVHEILREVGVEPANLSQHLRLLRAKGLVVQQRQGGNVLYSLRDPLLIVVLDAMRAYFHAHLEEALWVLRGIQED